MYNSPSRLKYTVIDRRDFHTGIALSRYSINLSQAILLDRHNWNFRLETSNDIFVAVSSLKNSRVAEQAVC